MALTPAEKSKAYRQRKAMAERKLGDATFPFLTEPFHAWLERTGAQGDWDDAMMYLDAAGLPSIEVTDDAGPTSRTGEVELLANDDYDPYAGYRGSVGKIESVIDYLNMCSETLAMIVNRYKLGEIEKRIKLIEEQDMSSPTDRKAVLDEIVKLTRLRDELGKQVRLTVYPWKVKATQI